MASLDRRSPRRSCSILLAVLVGYIGYTGAGIDSLGMQGLTRAKDKVAAMQDTIATLEAETDSAKRELAHGTVGGPAPAAGRATAASLGAAAPAGAGAQRGAQPARRHLDRGPRSAA